MGIMIEPFVFTFASLLWMALTAFSAFLVYITLHSTLWIIGKTPYTILSSNITSYPSMGLDIKCGLLDGAENCESFAKNGLGTDHEIFPTLWKIAFIFYTIGFYISCITTVTSLFTCYFQIIFGKNFYNIIGCIQALAGLLLLNSLVFYMSGWGSRVVKELCGPQASPFDVDQCSLGAAFYYATVAVILTFVCACISSLADRSTSSYRVTKRINAGKKFICLC